MIKGEILLKGDKSVTHRVLMISSLFEYNVKIYNPSDCLDIVSTINVLNKCGAVIYYVKNNLICSGTASRNPESILNCGNSGTTARLLTGLLFGMGISARIDGDKSLRSRPMDRLLKPLELMNLKYHSKGKKLPLDIYSSTPKQIKYKLDVPSAQVKSAILLAGFKNNISEVVDSYGTRDHTERMINYFQNCTFTKPYLKYKVSGDISSAAFLIASAVCIPNSDILIKNVLYNKTRFGFIETLIEMNADIVISNINDEYNEGICDIRVKYSQSIMPSKNHMSRIVSMIDEIPIFAVVSCFVNGITSVTNSKELRIKESDRISSLCSHFSSAGVMIKELSDGFIINPDKKLYNTIKINSQDHRIIMACEVFNLIIGSGLSSKYENEVSISFPDFYNILKELQK